MKKVFMTLMAVTFMMASAQYVQASGYEKKGSDSAHEMKKEIKAEAGSMKEDAGSMMEKAAMVEDGVAFDGLCPVCIFKGKFSKGLAEFASEYEGKTYYFANQEVLDMFLAEPTKYLENMEEKVAELKKAHMGMMKEGKGSMKGSMKDEMKDEMKGSDHKHEEKMEHKGSH
ncbi:MAG: YHS domain-containing protein [Candidatus Omnitrophota bacterium]|jgi:YHS domain-containing protein